MRELREFDKEALLQEILDKINKHFVAVGEKFANEPEFCHLNLLTGCLATNNVFNFTVSTVFDICRNIKSPKSSSPAPYYGIPTKVVGNNTDVFSCLIHHLVSTEFFSSAIENVGSE